MAYYGGGDGFTFGNAQKLVNMTAKYMFLRAYGDNGERSKFEGCDCPMDGVMCRFIEKGYEHYEELKGGGVDRK